MSASNYPVPNEELERLRELELLDVMDTLPERSYDGLCASLRQFATPRLP
jgi:hypothetical protein